MPNSSSVRHPYRTAPNGDGNLRNRNVTLGLDEEAFKRRLAAGARVGLQPVEDADESNLRELLGHYREALAESLQHAAAEEVARLAADWRARFVKAVPVK